jgi:hypothetical protein
MPWSLRDPHSHDPACLVHPSNANPTPSLSILCPQTYIPLFVFRLLCTLCMCLQGLPHCLPTLASSPCQLGLPVKSKIIYHLLQAAFLTAQTWDGIQLCATRKCCLTIAQLLLYNSPSRQGLENYSWGHICFDQ